MTEAPMAYLDILSLWSNLGIACLAVIVAMLVAAAWVSATSPIIVLIAFAVMAMGIGWAFSVQKVTSPRRLAEASKIDTRKEWRTLRSWTRGLAWSLAAGFVVMFAAATATYGSAAAITSGLPPPTSVYVCLVLGTPLLAAGIIGFVLVAVYWSLLADWANDLGLAMALRAAPFVMAVALPVGALFVGTLTLIRGTARMVIIAPAIAIAGAGLLICVWFAGAPFVRFAILCQWAKRNQSASLTRDRRASAAIVKRVEDGLAKDDPLPVPARPAAPVKPQGSFLPATGTDGYDLSPPDSGEKASP